jgi:hypothetical protein
LLPCQSKEFSSTFKFGTAYGAILGILAALEVRTVLVTPQVWKKHFRLDSDKEKGRALALRTFAKTPEHFARKERSRPRRGGVVGALWRDYGRRCAMTALALINGVLFRSPEQRTSKAGKPFVTATLKVKDGEASQWWRVTAFSESAQAEIMRLADGDSLAVQGAFKAEVYRPSIDEAKLSLSIIADQILTLRQPPASRSAKERKPKTPGDVPSRGGAAAFDDSIPFGAP